MQHVTEFLLKGKELCKRLRSKEGTTLSKGDLHLLKEQLQLLDAEVMNLLSQKEGRDWLAWERETPLRSSFKFMLNIPS